MNLSAPSEIRHQVYPPPLDPVSQPIRPLPSPSLGLSTPSQVHLQTRPPSPVSTSVTMSSVGGVDDPDGGSTPIRLEDLAQSELTEMIKVCKTMYMSLIANTYL